MHSHSSCAFVAAEALLQYLFFLKTLYEQTGLYLRSSESKVCGPFRARGPSCTGVRAPIHKLMWTLGLGLGIYPQASDVGEHRIARYLLKLSTMSGKKLRNSYWSLTCQFQLLPDPLNRSHQFLRAGSNLRFKTKAP